jgi:hypothetical protein
MSYDIKKAKKGERPHSDFHPPQRITRSVATAPPNAQLAEASASTAGFSDLQSNKIISIRAIAGAFDGPAYQGDLWEEDWRNHSVKAILAETFHPPLQSDDHRAGS